MNSREWQDPHFLEKGREKERAYYIPFENTEKALAGEREKSGEFQLLNGIWVSITIPLTMRYRKRLPNGEKFRFPQTGRWKVLSLPTTPT